MQAIESANRGKLVHALDSAANPRWPLPRRLSFHLLPALARVALALAPGLRIANPDLGVPAIGLLARWILLRRRLPDAGALARPEGRIGGAYAAAIGRAERRVIGAPFGPLAPALRGVEFVVSLVLRGRRQCRSPSRLG